ncbi:protein disulfide-isomerase A4 [Pseudophryne corroboree]|uniref:protein disulfide-isomerase A4 n=1 Tax=Pseudophryne corroboree TaxID=495146 RepID=UPI0030816418
MVAMVIPQLHSRAVTSMAVSEETQRHWTPGGERRAMEPMDDSQYLSVTMGTETQLIAPRTSSSRDRALTLDQSGRARCGAVLWTDEVKIELFGRNEQSQWHREHSKEGKMCSMIFQQILDANLMSSVKKLKLKRGWLLQMDNDPKHTSKSTVDYIKRCKLKEASSEAGVMASTTSTLARRIMWLRSWKVDLDSKKTLEMLPFNGDILFGEDLNKIVTAKTAFLPNPLKAQALQLVVRSFLDRGVLLPFGLAMSPRIFTKVMAVMIALLRRQGIGVLPYLDDLLILANSQDVLLSHLELTVQFLKAHGLLINWKKSSLVPARSMVPCVYPDLARLALTAWLLKLHYREPANRLLHGFITGSGILTSPETVLDDQDVKEENGVLVLTDANFDSFVADKDTVLLEFYAPWCGHCKQFVPEYEKIAKTLKDNDPPVPVAKIDATEATTIAGKYDIGGYPTIKILKKGQPIDYDGARTETEIVAKVKEISHPDWTMPPEATITLTDDNFKYVVDNADIILVEFYAPWCGHCKKLAPEYEKAAQELSKRTPAIPLAKVDATAEAELAKRYEVTGFPTLKIFRKGKAYDYSGPRQKYGIVDYMIEQASPPSKQVQTVKQVQEFLKDGDDVVVIGVFSDNNEREFQLYQDAANSLREDFKFHHTFSTEVASFLKVPTGQLAVMHPDRFQSKYEPQKFIYTIKDSTAEEDITEHVIKHALPLVGHRSTSNEAKRYTKRPLVLVYYTVDFSFDHRTATQYWRSKVLEVAKEFPEYTFAISNEDDYVSELKELGLSDSGEEVNVAILDANGKKYAKEPEEFDSDSLRDFVLAFKKGKLTPVLKSQPIPKNNKGPVKIVVGKTFEDIVMDVKSDVLIEFYAPWCGHCKSLEPIYNDVGKKYKSTQNIVIAKMDATANDIPSDKYKAEGFPTIYFAPKHNKHNPIKFEGSDRDLEGLSKFIDEHITKSKRKEEL